MKYELGADAGNISLISEDLVYKYGLRNDCSDLFTTVDLKAGQNVQIKINQSWNGTVSEIFVPEKTQKYYLGDCCYFIYLAPFPVLKFI